VGSRVPAANNPLADTTGADASVNNNVPVFFLAAFLNVNGSSGPPSVSRTITVREGRPIFFPVINSFYAPIGPNGDFNPFPPCASLTLTCAIQAASITQASDMAVQLDGTTLLDNAQIETFRQTSTSFFPVDLPPDNLFTLFGLTIQPCCTDQTFWTQDGFYITLDGLSVGTHVLHFEGEGQTFSGPISLSVTDTLNVVVPEPSTWAMMLVGFAGLSFAAYRTRRARRPPFAVPPQDNAGVDREDRQSMTAFLARRGNFTFDSSLWYAADAIRGVATLVSEGLFRSGRG
jgi:hypothetical protein